MTTILIYPIISYINGGYRVVNIAVVRKMNTISHEPNWVLIIGNPKSDKKNITIWEDGTMNYLGLTIPHVDGIQLVASGVKCSVVLLKGTLEDPYLMCFEMMNLTEDNINQIRNFLELSKLNMVGDYGR